MTPLPRRARRGLARCVRRMSPTIERSSGASPSMSAGRPPLIAPPTNAFARSPTAATRRWRRSISSSDATSSSRARVPGDQPANLQGIWNDSLEPPWDSKYTININTEMNYWPARADQSRRVPEPLFAMVLGPRRRPARARRAAMYGAGGWVAHHNTDLWRATAPVDGPHGACGRPAAHGSGSHCGTAISSRGTVPSWSASIRRCAARRSSSSIRWSTSRRIAGWSPLRRSRPKLAPVRRGDRGRPGDGQPDPSGSAGRRLPGV